MFRVGCRIGLLQKSGDQLVFQLRIGIASITTSYFICLFPCARLVS